MTTLNNQEKELLQQIMNDKYASGPFTGMIYNAHITTKEPVDALIKKALQVRIIATELSK